MLSCKRRDDAWFAALGKSCIHMTWSARGTVSLEVQSLLTLEAIFLPSFLKEPLGALFLPRLLQASAKILFEFYGIVALLFSNTVDSHHLLSLVLRKVSFTGQYDL